MMRESSYAGHGWVITLLCVAAMGLLTLNLVSLHSIADDAYISFRYLDHWLAGHGLVYNPGERVEGYTNLLWIVLLAPLRILGLAPELASVLLGIAALLALLWAVFRTASSLAQSPIAGWSALLLVAGSAHLAGWTVSGMETVCFAALLALANARLARDARHDLLSSTAFGLATLTRPSGALHALVAFCAAALWPGPERARSLRTLVWPALFFLAFPAAQLLFRLLYYDAFLSNSAAVKLGGEWSSLLPSGVAYLWRFLASGGWVLVVAAGLAVFARRAARSWVLWALAAQVLSHFAYVVCVGGDYFPYGRFLVPVVPALAVLGGVALEAVARRLDLRVWSWLPAAALVLAFLQTGLGQLSEQRRAFERVVANRAEREMIASWLKANLPPDTRLALNASGVIPYRTGMYTVDMLGLNDRHIAGAARGPVSDGARFVGHFKHDGVYVCSREPDVVLTSGARLHRGRNAEEATLQAAVNTFVGDREFLRAPACRDRYRPVHAELAPGRFLVFYRRQAGAAAAQSRAPASAEAWFQQGLSLMRSARLQEAIEAFRRSLEMDPNSAVARTNLGFCLFDLHRYAQAIEVFEQTLERSPQHFDALYGLALAHQNLGQRDEAIAAWRRYIAEAPDSTWKQQARNHLFRLGGAPP
jgi:hypothetical protein